MTVLTTDEIIKRMETRITMLNQRITILRRRPVMMQGELKDLFGEFPARHAHCTTLKSLGPGGQPTMDLRQQPFYLKLLHRVRDIGGDPALFVFIDTVHPDEMVNIDLQANVLKSWWQYVQIDDQLPRNINKLVTQTGIIQYLKRAKASGEPSTPMSGLTGCLENGIAKHNHDLDYFSLSCISSMAAEHHTTLRDELHNFVKEITPVGVMRYHDALKHIYRTGGIEALLLCTTLSRFELLYFVYYDKGKFEDWWDMDPVPRTILIRIKEVSQQIGKTCDDKDFLEFIKIITG